MIIPRRGAFEAMLRTNDGAHIFAWRTEERPGSVELVRSQQWAFGSQGLELEQSSIRSLPCGLGVRTS